MMGMKNKIELLVSYDNIPVGTMGYVIEVKDNAYKVYIPAIANYIHIKKTDFKKVDL